MAFDNYRYGTGLSNVGSYQSSGKPFVSGGIKAKVATGGDPKIVSFPSVTRWIYVVNNGSDDCKVGFSELGLAGSNFFTVKGNGTSERLEIKVTDLYFTGSDNIDVLAGLTGIRRERITEVSLSGSNWSGSSGIG